MPLTDTAVRTARPKEKPYKLADEKGLYLQIQPTGGTLWRQKYRFGGKETPNPCCFTAASPIRSVGKGTTSPCA